ncbi:MAG: glycosyltransferase [Candidatus Jettenia sp.]|nr:MAG: glycosyltransferase [Candidatus Jettenia sp.]
MNILMMTNTYKPFIGGVERSVEMFTNEYRKRGHRVVIVAPTFRNMPREEKDVIRVPAIQNFNETDFSVQLPIPGIFSEQLKAFQPDIVHSHHPYLIGDSALRVAAKYKVPLIFTFHTLYERYTHYVPGDSPALKRFVVALSAGYANLCDRVFAPSQSIADLLRQRGVETRIDIVPTGIYVKKFAKGYGMEFRRSLGIPQDAFVVGFVSRIAPEKNIMFLAQAVAIFLKKEKNTYFLAIGKGPLENEIRDFFRRNKLEHRFRHPGALENRELVNAYHAMDVFAFASQTETQGLVLTEAMAAGIPVVALDAPGVREVLNDRMNGRLLFSDNEEEFASALQWVASLSAQEKENLKNAAREIARCFSIDRCAEHVLSIYKAVIDKGYTYRNTEDSTWASVIRMIKAETDLIMTKAISVGAMLKSEE